MSRPRTHSLRFRFAIASLLWIGVGTLLAGLVISGLYRRHVTQTFTGDLQNHLDELVMLTDLSPKGMPILDRPLSDPRFEQPNSGFYWQVERNARAEIISASLLGHHLTPVADTTSTEAFWTKDRRERLLRIDRIDANGLRFSITASGRALEREISAFHRDLAISLVVFATLMLIGAVLQIQYGLGPVRRLTDRIEALRRGQLQRLPDDVQSEFVGIVGRLNELLEAHATLVSRARVEAGNLGHNLRTPLALISGEAEQLAHGDNAEAAAFILDQCGRMQRQIDFQMKRAAAAGARGAGAVPDLLAFVGPIVGAMRRLHAERMIAIDAVIAPGFSVRCDPGDLAEILSNLIDNACKWAVSCVDVSAVRVGTNTEIRVADDGPGIPEQQRSAVLDIGVRLDDTKPGTGLGLPISRDLVLLYGGALRLDAPERGTGLIVTVILPS
jgi:signal transduction histidine kinase